MSAVINDIADAVAAELAGASLSLSFAVTREYVPVEKLDELDGLTLMVLPISVEIEPQTRRSDSFAYDIGVGVSERLDPPSHPTDARVMTQAVLDGLMSFVEEVVDLFRGVTLETAPYGNLTASCTAIRNDPVFDQAYLDEHRTFRSAVFLTFTVTRARPA